MAILLMNDILYAGTSSECGFVRHSSTRCLWFSERLSKADSDAPDIKLEDDLQKSMSALEMLAQMAIVWMTAQIFPGHRIPIRITSLSDNSGTERRSNKLFTMKYPQCLFVEKLYLLSPTFFMKIIVETFCSLAMCLFIRVGMLAVRSVDDIL